MLIDVHVHPFCKEASITPSIETAIERMIGVSRNKARKEASAAMVTGLFTQNSIENTIREMDQCGIDKACIVAMNLSTFYGVELVTNEDVSRIAKAYPDRFIPFASVDPSMGRLAVDQLIYAVEKLGCRGLKLVPPVQHFDFSDPKHDGLWQTALDLGIPVWSHCSHQLSHPESDARLGHPMLVEPVAHKFRDLVIILGHCGFPWVWEAWSMAVRHPNLYVDISAHTKLYNHFPWDAYSKQDIENKLLFATDYPLVGFKETIDALDDVNISEEFKNKILNINANEVLRMD